MSFQKRLRILRLNRGLKQKELAEKLNIVKSTISAYELGKITPTAENLISLARFFDVSTDYLLGESDYSRRISSDIDNEKALLSELGHKNLLKDILYGILLNYEIIEKKK
ncbi:MAG: helix-turn-helix domain-containing protein [Oscillospiraceae bacterium]|nr:helix-turn-helix domain-containing protein [Oscillospiraceae bacterium]